MLLFSGLVFFFYFHAFIPLLFFLLFPPGFPFFLCFQFSVFSSLCLLMESDMRIALLLFSEWTLSMWTLLLLLSLLVPRWTLKELMWKLLVVSMKVPELHGTLGKNGSRCLTPKKKGTAVSFFEWKKAFASFTLKTKSFTDTKFCFLSF